MRQIENQIFRPHRKGGKLQLIIEFKNFVGEESLSQIGRIKGIYENLSEKINEYLEDYQEEYEKQQKKEEKLRKKELKKAGKNKEQNYHFSQPPISYTNCSEWLVFQINIEWLSN